MNSYGQNDSVDYRNQLKLSPVKMVDLINPGVEISYERRSDRFATQLSMSYLTDIFGITEFRQLRGFRIGLEGKRFLNSQRKKIFKPKKHFKPYFSADLVFANVNFKDCTMFGIENPSLDSLSYNYLDTYGVKKQTAVLNFKYGVQKIYNHFVFEFSFGFGFKYRNVRHYDRLVPTDKMQGTRHPNIYYISTKESNGLTINIPATLKVGYTF